MPNRSLALVTLLWLGTCGMWLYDPASPWVSTGGDTVTPAEVRAGGAIAVSRSFKITRETDMVVTRSMVRGDCNKACEILDLPDGRLTMKPGTYTGLIREHVIPPIASPGEWRFVFRIHWQDRFGRWISENLPELKFTVVK